MLPWSYDFVGRSDDVWLDSAAPRDNPLGELATRSLWVYLPPAHTRESVAPPR